MQPAQERVASVELMDGGEFVREAVPTGYLHPGYAASLARFGTPRPLARSGGWVLERRIPGDGGLDAMGCYPLFACRDWSALHDDVAALRGHLVALSLVTDPFGRYDEPLLAECFDRVAPFKEHLVADLRRNPEEYISGKHRRKAQRGFRAVTVERCANPATHADEWAVLYAHLIERHEIHGLRAFDRQDLAAQLAVPGAVMYRAVYEGETVGANLYYLMDRVAYGHLSAFSPLGYQLYASYALWWTAIHGLRDEAEWMDIGAAAGLRDDDANGLTRFKRGWASDARTAYFCGSVLDPARYREIVRACDADDTGYFPAYRAGEFG